MCSKMQNKFVSKFISQLYLQPDFADVHFVFTADGQTVKVPAHKAILAAASSVFRAMFFGPIKENEDVAIVDADASAFKEFLQFFYLPEVTLTIQNMEAVVRLGDKYDMLEYVNACAGFLENQLNKDNIILGYQLAISLNNQKLKQFCENEIKHADNNIFKSDAFLQCDLEVVSNILQMEGLCCNEMDLFDACIAWAKSTCEANSLDGNDSENLRNQMGHCFHLIQFGTMANEEIARIISNELYVELFTKHEMAEILCMRSMNNFQSKTFKHIMRNKWNDNNVLTCVQGTLVEYKYVLQDKESTWFSSNTSVLLGEIAFACIFTSEGQFLHMDSAINIIEYDQIFPTIGWSKILYEGTMNFKPNASGGCVKLTRPIIINPENIYEIRLDTTSIPSNSHHCYSWKSEVNLDEGVTIKFHKNAKYNSSQHGLVRELKFNRIAK